MLKLFTNDFVEEIRFKFTKGDEDTQYGEVVSKRPNGMIVINWNNEGVVV